MKEFLLFIIGFSFALYIFGHRYMATNEISEFLLCLERIALDKLFKYNMNSEIREKIGSIDLKAPNFDVSITSEIFRDPKIVGGDLYVKRKRILEFLNGGYFPHDEYFRINTGLISEFLRNCDDFEAKLNFATDYIVGNFSVSEMAESIRDNGSWSLDKTREQQRRMEFKNIFEKLDENQLDHVALYFLSEAKKNLISLIESIKQKYIENRYWRAVKRASLIFIILFSLQAIFYFAWHIDLLDRIAAVFGTFFESNEY